MSDAGVNLAYETYWQRKQLLSKPLPPFPVVRWWPGETLSEIERIFFDAIAPARRLLDFGAGDQRIMRRFRAAGFHGKYETLDIGGEFQHDYRDLAEAPGAFDAILCLDVIEHLPLATGLKLIADLAARLEPGGVLIVQTPNGRCIRNPFANDMTHVQLYNILDLWAFQTVLKLETTGYRVAFDSPGRGGALSRLLGRYVVTRLLGADYADNIATIARRPKT